VKHPEDLRLEPTPPRSWPALSGCWELKLKEHFMIGTTQQGAKKIHDVADVVPGKRLYCSILCKDERSIWKFL